MPQQREWKEERSTVYLYASAAGWPRTWDDFDDPAQGFTNPDQPHYGCDMRYYYHRLGQIARMMDVDGIVMTTPHINGGGLPQDHPDHYRFRLEGRLDGLVARSGVADDRAILDGLVLLRQQFSGRLILNVGHPNEAEHVAMSLDKDYCDGFLKGCIGPWMRTGYFDAVVWDNSGSRSYLPVLRACMNSVQRLWNPRQLGEPHPHWLSGGYPFNGSLTARASVTGAFVPWAMPITAEFFPVLIAYITPSPFDPETYADALEQIRLGRSVAIQAWQVGYNQLSPTVEQRQRWEAFRESARHIRGVSPDGSHSAADSGSVTS